MEYVYLIAKEECPHCGSEYARAYNIEIVDPISNKIVKKSIWECLGCDYMWQEDYYVESVENTINKSTKTENNHMFQPLIIAVDFDGTLFETDYPNVIVRPINKVINWCKQKRQEGHTLILWTCRTGHYLEEAIQACKEVGLEFDYVNENAKVNMDKYEIDSRKIGADIYLDDRAMKIDELI